MGITHCVDPERRLVHLVYTDPFNLSDWCGALLNIFSDPAFEPGFNILVDRRNASPPSPDFAKSIATFVHAERARLGDGRVAILVRQANALGMAKMQEALNLPADVPTRAFTDEPEAREWLQAR